nr:MobA protein [Rahnella sp. WMR104]
MIDALDFKHRYTSGVLSFSPEDNVTPVQEQAIMDRFERVAFAGLEADRYSILWVRHAHAGHHELHFVTPRVELATGNSLNIRPPGEATKKVFDDLRSEINARYGFADPDDPSRTRVVAVPDHALKMAAEALRRGEKPESDVRLLIDGVLSQRAVQGLIRDRADLVEQVSDLGLAVTREGKDYITVSEPQSGQRWRLKGALYERDYTAGRAIEAAESCRERQFGVPDAAAAERFAKRVNGHIAGRAEYHAARYGEAAAGHDRGIQPESERLAVEHRKAPCAVSGPEHDHGLGRYLSERLGDEYLSGKPDSGQLGHDIQPERDGVAFGEPDGGGGYRPERQGGVCRTAERVESGERLDGGETGRTADNEVGDDRAGNALIERIEKFTERAKRAVESLRTGAARFTEHVRAYCAGQREAESAGNGLAGAGEGINAAALAFWEPVRAEQAIAHHRQEEQQRLIEAEKERQEVAHRSSQRRYTGPNI